MTRIASRSRARSHDHPPSTVDRRARRCSASLRSSRYSRRASRSSISLSAYTSPPSATNRTTCREMPRCGISTSRSSSSPPAARPRAGQQAGGRLGRRGEHEPHGCPPGSSWTGAITGTNGAVEAPGAQQRGGWSPSPHSSRESDAVRGGAHPAVPLDDPVFSRRSTLRPVNRQSGSFTHHRPCCQARPPVTIRRAAGGRTGPRHRGSKCGAVSG